MIVINYSVSYFIYDLAFGLIRKYNDPMIHVHHLIMVLGGGYIYFMQKHASIYLQSMQQGESSNPFLTVMEIAQFNDVGPTLQAVLPLLFAASFILLRCGVSPYSLYHIMRSKTDIPFKFAAAAMYCLSLLWIWMIVNKLAKILATYVPGVPFFKKWFNFMKLIRPFKFVYYALAVFISFYWMIKNEYYGTLHDYP
jgi:hypothetical protein